MPNANNALLSWQNVFLWVETVMIHNVFHSQLLVKLFENLKEQAYNVHFFHFMNIISCNSV